MELSSVDLSNKNSWHLVQKFCVYLICNREPYVFYNFSNFIHSNPVANNRFCYPMVHLGQLQLAGVLLAPYARQNTWICSVLYEFHGSESISILVGLSFHGQFAHVCGDYPLACCVLMFGFIRVESTLFVDVTLYFYMN